MYEYFIGCLILAAIWLFAIIARKDLRKPMIWSGIAYILVMAIVFVLFKLLILFNLIKQTIVPGYWNPDTVLNLGRLTGGFGIEDTLFQFFVGGIAAFIYELFFNKRIKIKNQDVHHIRALIIGIVAAVIFAIASNSNLIYSLVAFGFVGALSIWIERRDLIKQSLFGGAAFLLIYSAAFLLFNTIFPNFISQNYNLSSLSGIYVFSLPIEELLYAFSFGLIWSPIYKYYFSQK